MQIEEFAEITKCIIQRDGFESFLPTLCLPARRHLSVLQGVPAEEQHDIRAISLKWAGEKAADQEEYLLAYKAGESELIVVRHYNGQTVEKVFPLT